jgi:NADH-quinone oxidoreductase subunit C
MDGHAILLRLTAAFDGQILEVRDHRGDHTAVVDRGAILDVLGFCRDEPDLRFDMLVDLTAVDYLKHPGWDGGPRFEVVYHLYSLPHNHRLRLKVPVEEDHAVAPSAVPLWPIANWFEREVWDMFGIRFEGHPALRRLLMYEEFQGHPLRKDYPVNKRQPLIGPRN